LASIPLWLTKARVINLSGNHCANISVATHIIHSIVKGDPHINNILLMGTTIAKDHQQRVLGNFGVVGDGAGLILLQREGGRFRTKDQAVMVNGALHKADISADNSLLHFKYLDRGRKNRDATE
jgi:hypothetical protein